MLLPERRNPLKFTLELLRHVLCIIPVANHPGRDQDQQLRAAHLVPALPEQFAQYRDPANDRYAAFRVGLRVLYQAPQDYRLPRIDGDGAFQLALLDGGRIDVGRGGADRVADFLLDVHRHQATAVGS